MSRLAREPAPADRTPDAARADADRLVELLGRKERELVEITRQLDDLETRLRHVETGVSPSPSASRTERAALVGALGTILERSDHLDRRVTSVERRLDAALEEVFGYLHRVHVRQGERPAALPWRRIVFALIAGAVIVGWWLLVELI